MSRRATHVNRGLVRNYNDRPTLAPPTAPTPSWAGSNPLHAIARSLAEADPLAAARQFGAGILAQARPGQIAALCAAVDVLVADDATVLADLIEALSRRQEAASTQMDRVA